MEVQEFTAPERQLSRAAALLREQGVSDGQLAWCAQHVDREWIGAILNGRSPPGGGFVRAGATTESDEERRAYVGFAATKPQRLRAALRIEHPKRGWPPGKVREETARLRARGVSDAEIAAAGASARGRSPRRSPARTASPDGPAARR